MSVVPGLHGPLGRAIRLGAWLGTAVLVGLLAHAAGDGMDGEGRARLVRYVGILISAGLAIGAPHALYPDPHATALQLSNTAPRRLLHHQVMRWAPILLLLAVPALVMALGIADPQWTLAAEGALAVLALGLYVLARTASIGPRALAWERSEAGGWYRALYTRMPPVRFLVPDPLVPGLLLTGEVFLMGGALAIAGQQFGVGLGASAVLLAVSAGLLARKLGVFDHAFWATHGVLADAFRASAGPASGREPVQYGAIYWAPHAIRPAVWAGLMSLDRRFPLGRMAVVLLALVVGVHAADTEAGVRLAALVLYVIGLNGAVALAATEAVLPEPLTYRLGGAVRWTLVRFLMSVRWLPPLALTLAFLAWVMDSVEVKEILMWSVVDLVAAALSAGIVTLLSRARLRRAVA